MAKFPLVPYADRNCGYTNSHSYNEYGYASIHDKESCKVCNNDKYWALPNYPIGSVWKFYGGFSKIEYTVQLVTEHQIVCTSVGRNGSTYYDVFACRPGKYAGNGTPTLRTRIK